MDFGAPQPRRALRGEAPQAGRIYSNTQYYTGYTEQSYNYIKLLIQYIGKRVTFEKIYL